MAMTQPVTLACVVRLTQEMRASVADALESLGRETHPNLEPGWQKAVAKRLDMSQPTVSDTWKRKKLGIELLLAVRHATHRSIDDILGLPLTETDQRRAIRVIEDALRSGRSAHLEEQPAKTQRRARR